MLDDQDMDFASSPEQVGLILSVGLLKEEKVIEFVVKVREREGIWAPVDRCERDENLAEFPPEQFVEEARPIAEEAEFGSMAEDMGLVSDLRATVEDGVAEEFELNGSALMDEARRIVEEAGFGSMAEGLGLGNEQAATLENGPPGQLELIGSLCGLVENILQVDSRIEVGARVIARHIVTGLIDPPEPIPSHMSVIGKVPLRDGAKALFVLITPYADIETVLKQIEAAFREHCQRGERNRWPGKFAETLWLRHCAFDMGLDLGKKDTFRQVADLAIQIWPELRPDAKPDSPEWKAAMERHADRMQGNSETFERLKEEGLWKQET